MAMGLHHVLSDQAPFGSTSAPLRASRSGPCFQGSITFVPLHLISSLALQVLRLIARLPIDYPSQIGPPFIPPKPEFAIQPLKKASQALNLVWGKDVDRNSEENS